MKTKLTFYKTLKLLLLSSGILLCAAVSKAQNVYSAFAIPAPGSHFTYTYSGACIGCFFSNGPNAASTSLTDSTHFFMSAGASNQLDIALKLTDTANISAGIVLMSNTGLLSPSDLNAITFSTYLTGNWQETFNSGSGLSLNPVNGTQQSITAPATLPFDEVRVVINSFPATVWDFNVFYAYGMAAMPLPVNVLDIKAVINYDGTHYIAWTAAEEAGCKGYSLLFSEDGFHFKEIYYTDVEPVAGMVSSYSHTNKTVSKTQGYYQLKMHMNNGSTEYSEIVKAKGGLNNDIIITASPNPFKDELKVESTDDIVKIIVLNYLGEQIYHQELNQQQVQIAASHWASGLYSVITIDSQGQIRSCKVIKQ